MKQHERDRDFDSVMRGTREEIPLEQLNAAAVRLAALTIRARGTKVDLVEILEMVGCIDPETAATATATVAGDLTPLGGDVPVVAPLVKATVVANPRQWCFKRRHRLTGPTADVWISPSTGKRQCHPCRNETDRRRRRTAKLLKEANDHD